MVTRAHEAPVELVNKSPAILLTMLEAAGARVPADTVVALGSERCTQMNPAELRADAVATLKSAGGPVTSVIIEVQRRRDDEKRRTWPVYVADVWRRTGIPVILLVICPTPSTSDWAAEPIDMGLAATVRPTVLSPAQLPVITDPAAFDGRVEVAVLAALMHAEGPQADAIIAALGDILATIRVEQAERYAGYLIEVLPHDARSILENLMSAQTHDYQTAFARMEARGEARGEVREEAHAILTVLETRGVEVPREVAERVRACTDLDVLRGWLVRAVTVSTAAEMFVD